MSGSVELHLPRTRPDRSAVTLPIGKGLDTKLQQVLAGAMPERNDAVDIDKVREALAKPNKVRAVILCLRIKTEDQGVARRYGAGVTRLAEQLVELIVVQRRRLPSVEVIQFKKVTDIRRGNLHDSFLVTRLVWVTIIQGANGYHIPPLVPLPKRLLEIIH